MKLKRIIAAALATAVVATTCALSAFAATTITLDSEFPGNWCQGTKLKKADLVAVGEDVKVTLDIEYVPGLVAPTDQIGMQIVNSQPWTNLLQADIQVAGEHYIKGDGFIPLNVADTSLTFYISQDTISKIEDGDDNGLAFNVKNVMVKSATLEATDGAGVDFIILEEGDEKILDICFGDGAAAEAPAATENAAAGNTSAAVLVSVMALAGVAMAATKIKK